MIDFIIKLFLEKVVEKDWNGMMKIRDPYPPNTVIVGQKIVSRKYENNGMPKQCQWSIHYSVT